MLHGRRVAVIGERLSEEREPPPFVSVEYYSRKGRNADRKTAEAIGWQEINQYDEPRRGREAEKSERGATP